MTDAQTLALGGHIPQRRATDLTAVIFLFTAAVCLMPIVTPPIALAVGALLALSTGNPFQKQTNRLCKSLLQSCVVLLGFGMDLPAVLKAGVSGAGMAAGTIAVTFLLGIWIGRKLNIATKTSALICAGTAICGGSAIAAVGSVIGVAEGEITVAMGTVFLLNAVALYVFPPVGHLLHMSQTQFGTWAGIAIHDISSVVGAASRFGLPALQTATAVKLSRALWIIPVSAIAAGVFRGPAGAQRKPLQIPWFIGLFLLASVCRSLFAPVAHIAPIFSHLATRGLTFTLFLVGAGLSAATLRAIGIRPLVQGIALWIFVSIASLMVILKFTI
jgi:uncharacterized integral membrane protein (TIGR00698 family)